MSKIFIDANLFIYLNTITDSIISRMYEDFYIDVISNYKAYTDVLVLDELIYISKKKFRIPFNLTIKFIDSIVQPYVSILALDEEVFKETKNILMEFNIKPSDALHIAAMKRNNIIYIVSEDYEIDKVSGIKRIWIDKE